MKELFSHKGHLKPLALEAGEVIHRRCVPGGGLLHGPWGSRGERKHLQHECLVF